MQMRSSFLQACEISLEKFPQRLGGCRCPSEAGACLWSEREAVQAASIFPGTAGQLDIESQWRTFESFGNTIIQGLGSCRMHPGNGHLFAGAAHIVPLYPASEWGPCTANEAGGRFPVQKMARSVLPASGMVIPLLWTLQGNLEGKLSYTSPPLPDNLKSVCVCVCVCTHTISHSSVLSWSTEVWSYPAILQLRNSSFRTSWQVMLQVRTLPSAFQGPEGGSGNL